MTARRSPCGCSRQRRLWSRCWVTRRPTSSGAEVRTFVPVLAGVCYMRYPLFLGFDVIEGLRRMPA